MSTNKLGTELSDFKIVNGHVEAYTKLQTMIKNQAREEKHVQLP
jgi:hypothetical protein